MKILISILWIACAVLSLTSCGKTANNQEKMLQIIAEEECISDELRVQTVGTVELDDTLLICAMTVNKNQEDQYYASEFTQEEESYKFVRSYNLYERGMNMYSLNWADGYVFISNNDNSKSLQIRFPNGEQEDELIVIDKVPFVYYLDLSDIHRKKEGFSFEYYFIDKDGKSISF